MRGQRPAPAAPYSRERPGTHFTGGWVGLRAGLDRCGKSPTGIRSPDRPPVGSRYTDYATRPAKWWINDDKSTFHLRFHFYLYQFSCLFGWNPLSLSPSCITLIKTCPSLEILPTYKSLFLFCELGRWALIIFAAENDLSTDILFAGMLKSTLTNFDAAGSVSFSCLESKYLHT